MESRFVTAVWVLLAIASAIVVVIDTMQSSHHVDQIFIILFIFLVLDLTLQCFQSIKT